MIGTLSVLGKIGKGIIKAGFPIVGSLISEGKEDVVDKVSSVLNCNPEEILDKINSSSESKASLRMLEKELEVKHHALDNERLAKAMDTEIARYNSNASWLAKNIMPILAIWIMMLFSFVVTMVLMGKISSTPEIQHMVVVNLFGLVMLIAGYYWGSSDRKNKR